MGSVEVMRLDGAARVVTMRKSRSRNEVDMCMMKLRAKVRYPVNSWDTSASKAQEQPMSIVRTAVVLFKWSIDRYQLVAVEPKSESRQAQGASVTGWFDFGDPPIHFVHLKNCEPRTMSARDSLPIRTFCSEC